MKPLEDATWKRWEPEGNSNNGDEWILNIEQSAKWAALVCLTFLQSFARFPLSPICGHGFPASLSMLSISLSLSFSLFLLIHFCHFSFFLFFSSSSCLDLFTCPQEKSTLFILPSFLFLLPASSNLHPFLPPLLPSSSLFFSFPPS